MEYLPRLDSLRFLAALAVICYHCGSILPCGWMGVPLFFVRSGFLITGILLRLRDSANTLSASLQLFFIRRMLRIMPLYYAFVLALTLFFLLSGYPRSFTQAAIYLYT